LLITILWFSESCCGRSEDQTAYLGETAVIQCKYPDTYKDRGKQLFKVQNGSLEPIIHTFGHSATNERFSLKENEQEHVFSVTIADVERSDAGVYFCGIDNNNIIYTPLPMEIQLHVSGEKQLATIYTLNVHAMSIKPCNFDFCSIVSMWATVESRTDVSVQSGELFAQIYIPQNITV